MAATPYLQIIANQSVIFMRVSPMIDRTHNDLPVLAAVHPTNRMVDIERDSLGDFPWKIE